MRDIFTPQALTGQGTGDAKEALGSVRSRAIRTLTESVPGSPTTVQAISIQLGRHARCQC